MVLKSNSCKDQSSEVGLDRLDLSDKGFLKF